MKAPQYVRKPFCNTPKAATKKPAEAKIPSEATSRMLDIRYGMINPDTANIIPDGQLNKAKR